mgnify:CR=1 FL=1
MRLPIVPPLSTKDGISNKNARMTNVLREWEKAVIRPGLSTIDTLEGGNGAGLATFGTLSGVAADDQLVAINGDTIHIVQNDIFTDLSAVTSTPTTLTPPPVSGSFTSLGAQTNVFGTGSYGARVYLTLNGVLYAINDLPTQNGNTYSTSNGTSWSLVNTDAAVSQFADVGCVMGSKMYTSGDDGSFILSSTGGAWTADAASGLLSPCQAMYSLGTTLYILFLSVNILYSRQSTDNGLTWDVEVQAGQGNLHGFGVVKLGSAIYTIGGRSSGGVYTNHIWKSTNGRTFTDLGAAGFSARAFPGCAVNGNYAIVAGGFGGGANERTDIWISANMTNWIEVVSDTSPSSIVKGAMHNWNDQISAVSDQHGCVQCVGSKVFRLGVVNSLSSAINHSNHYSDV